MNQSQYIFFNFLNNHACLVCHVFISIIWKGRLKSNTIQIFNLIYCTRCHIVAFLLPNINSSFLQCQSLWLMDCQPPCKFWWKNFLLYFSIDVMGKILRVDWSHGTTTYLSNLTKTYVGGHGGNVWGLYNFFSTLQEHHWWVLHLFIFSM